MQEKVGMLDLHKGAKSFKIAFKGFHPTKKFDKLSCSIVGPVASRTKRVTADSINFLLFLFAYVQ